MAIGINSFLLLFLPSFKYGDFGGFFFQKNQSFGQVPLAAPPPPPPTFCPQVRNLATKGNPKTPTHHCNECGPKMQQRVCHTMALSFMF